MYSILVCFKIAPDYDAMAPSEWELKGGYPCTKHVPSIYGCFDEAALEHGLCLKETCIQDGQDVSLHALSVLPEVSYSVFNRLYAVGYDKVICLESEKLTSEALAFRPEVTARLIADYVKRVSYYDVLLLGQQAPPGNSGLVPAFLAARLNLKCRYDLEGLTNSVLQEPFIGIIGNQTNAYLRIPTLREKLSANNKIPEIVPVSDEMIDCPENYARPTLTCAHKKRTCKMVKKNNMYDMAVYLYEQLVSGEGG